MVEYAWKMLSFGCLTKTARVQLSFRPKPVAIVVEDVGCILAFAW
jgi:hypothetical protein